MTINNKQSVIDQMDEQFNRANMHSNRVSYIKLTKLSVRTDDKHNEANGIITCKMYSIV